MVTTVDEKHFPFGGFHFIYAMVGTKNVAWLYIAVTIHADGMNVKDKCKRLEESREEALEETQTGGL